MTEPLARQSHSYMGGRVESPSADISAWVGLEAGLVEVSAA